MMMMMMMMMMMIIFAVNGSVCAKDSVDFAANADSNDAVNDAPNESSFIGNLFLFSVASNCSK